MPDLRPENSRNKDEWGTVGDSAAADECELQRAIRTPNTPLFCLFQTAPIYYFTTQATTATRSVRSDLSFLWSRGSLQFLGDVVSISPLLNDFIARLHLFTFNCFSGMKLPWPLSWEY